MSEEAPFYVGNDPHGYGGEEVSQAQADAYAAAIADGLRAKFPGREVVIGLPAGGLGSNAKQLALIGWVQANWRRIRAEVNTAQGWEEQFGGTLLVDTQRCF